MESLSIRTLQEVSASEAEISVGASKMDQEYGYFVTSTGQCHMEGNSVRIHWMYNCWEADRCHSVSNIQQGCRSANPIQKSLPRLGLAQCRIFARFSWLHVQHTRSPFHAASDTALWRPLMHKLVLLVKPPT